MKHWITTIFICSAVILITRQALLAEIIYVDQRAVGNNDGSSWTNAFEDVQPALEAAQPGDVIWVAAGVYKPTKRTQAENPRTATFKLKNNVALYGGFNGTEKAIDKRDWIANETILSGDLNGDDGPEFTNYDDNSYHVVYADHTGSSSIIDGFTITHGNGNLGFARSSRGGGMYNDFSSTTISNCHFKDNTAGSGAGLTNWSSQSIISNCIFSGNVANSVGGAMRNSASLTVPADLRIIDCTFRDNRAKWGGGIYTELSVSSAVVLTSCTFKNNKSSEDGGAIFNSGLSLRMSRCVIADNTAKNGGGMYNRLGDLEISGSLFERNTSTMQGGAVYNNQSTATYSKCTFVGNKADLGGGIANLESTTEVVNCVLSANYAATSGGATHYKNSSSDKPFKVVMCVLRQNRSDGDGGGISSVNGSNSKIVGCTFRNNIAKNSGGGMILTDADRSQIIDSTFEENRANLNGGGIAVINSTPLITRCRYIANNASADGGGVFTDGGGLFWSCIFGSNRSGRGGGLFFSLGGDLVPKIVNSTIVNNLAVSGGGIYSDTTESEIKNTIIWHNSSSASRFGKNVFYIERNILCEEGELRCLKVPRFSYSNIEGIRTGPNEAFSRCLKLDPDLTRVKVFSDARPRSAVQSSGICIIPDEDSIVSGLTADGRIIGIDEVGNIDREPLLTTDGHLRAGSPCINAGTGSGAPPDDIDGDLRPILGAGFDIGADEFIDGDGDGLPDWLEEQITGTAEGMSPQRDADKDGLTNLEEYELSTSQMSSDTDLDGRSDGDELIKQTDPRHPDSILAPFRIHSRFSAPENEVVTQAIHSEFDDIDGDGDLDLLVSLGNGIIKIFTNYGSAVSPKWDNPDETPLVLTISVFEPFAVGNINDDTASDIIAIIGSQLIVLRNSGNGSWSQPETLFDNISLGSRPYLSDIDSDGDTDIILVDAEGRMTLIENVDGIGERWNVPDSTLAGSTAITQTSETSGDLDLDGDLDRFIGLDAEGQPVIARNIDEHLTIFPRYLTLVEGDSIALEANQDDVGFSIAQNQSKNPSITTTATGGGTTTALYTAGAVDDGMKAVDIIKGEANGVHGLVVVNIIDNSLADRRSKILIIVGTRSTRDSLFPISKRLAMDAYAVCRQRGIPANNIRLLTPDGSLSETVHRGWPIEAHGNNGELERILTNDTWAKSADDLIIYFADHGIVGKNGRNEIVGQLLLQPGNPPLTLSSTQLKSWLNRWQKGNKTCLVIVETCYSGRFVRELQGTIERPRRNRIVLASSQPRQLAHFQANGRISFSQFFWDEIDTGATVGNAFLNAQLSLIPDTITENNRGFSQNPIFDYDGNGKDDRNPEIVMTRHIGLEGLLSGVERPIVQHSDVAKRGFIQKSSPSAHLDHVVDVGDTITVWVDSVQSNNGVSKVFAYIAPPTLETNVDGGSALTEMPNIELIDHITRHRIKKSDVGKLPDEDKEYFKAHYSEREQYYELNAGVSIEDKQTLREMVKTLGYFPRYEADFDSLDVPGVYQILIFVEDNWGMLSPPRRIQLTVQGPPPRAIIIEGTGVSTGVNRWKNKQIEKMGVLAYQALVRRSFKDDEILWLAHRANHGKFHRKIDRPATKSNLHSAILNGFDGSSPGVWDEAPAQLVIYLVGNYAVKFGQSGLLLKSGELITPLDLKGWLDDFQKEFPESSVVVVVETDNAGAFLSGLSASDPGRYVIASSKENESTLRMGDITFGSWFWGEVRRDRSIQEAVANAIRFSRASGFEQFNLSGDFEPRFLLDDDGSGSFNSKRDGRNTQNEYIGGQFLTGDIDVQILSVTEPIHVLSGAEASVKLWAKVFSMTTDLPLKVWATIVPPDNEGKALKKVRLCFNESTRRYEVEISNRSNPDCPRTSEFANPTFRALGFDSPGPYVAVIHAESRVSSEKSAVPVPVEINYDVASSGVLGDVNLSYQRLIPDNAPVVKALSNTGDDFYRIWVGKGQRLSLELKTLAGKDLFLDILRPRIDGSEDTRLIRVDDWGSGIDERIWSWEPPYSGWIVIRVGEIKLRSVTRVGETIPESQGARYSIHSTLEHGSGPDGFEVDNCPAQASSVSLLGGEFQVHNFHVADDEDWVVFFREQGHSYDVDIKNVGINFSGVIQLYAETPILRMSCPYNEKRFSPLPNSTVVLNNQDSASLQVPNTKSGNIYVRIKNNSKNSGLGTNYQISVHDTTGEFKPVQIFLRSGDNRPLIGQVCKTECRSCRPPTALCKNNNRFDVRGDITVNLPDEKCHQIRAFFSGQEHPQPAECQQYGGETNLETFTFKNVTTQTINFNRSGWHHISLNVQPGDRSPEAIFGAILGNVERIDHNNEFFLKDNAVFPEDHVANFTNFNTLDQLEDGKGYWILMNAPGILNIPGTVIDTSRGENEIVLTKGWNNVGYVLQGEIPVEDALRDLLDKPLEVEVREGGSGKRFPHEFPHPQLEMMMPGSGYWINVSEDVSFRYHHQP